MDIEEVKSAIKEIRRKAKDDPESAHVDRDDLYRGVLKAIAGTRKKGCYATIAEYEELAKEALKAEKIKWSATA